MHANTDEIIFIDSSCTVVWVVRVSESGSVVEGAI